MGASRQMRDDEPLMVAWKAHKNTEEYASCERWARHIAAQYDMDEQHIKVAHPHLDGPLWGMFMAGWIAAGGQIQ